MMRFFVDPYARAGGVVAELHHSDPRRRALVKDAQLGWPTTAAAAAAVGERAAAATSRATSFALHIALEHEMEVAHGPPPGQTPWFLPLTAGQRLQQLAERLQLSADLAREHVSLDWEPTQAATVGSIAALGGFEPNRLFERFHPRALLLPLLTHAFHTARGNLPRTVAFQLYSRIAVTGEAACKSYGAFKQPGRARAMVIGGLAAMTGDTITPVTMFPLVHGTWDDPEHPDFRARQETCDAAAALHPFGLLPDGSIAAFGGHHFDLLEQARTIFEFAAREGSRVCDDYGIDPEQVLARALPSRVIGGRLDCASATANHLVSDVPVLPGLSADLLRTADDHGLEVTAFALDHMTDSMRELLPQLKKLSIVLDHDEYVHGFELTDMLIGDGRWQIPGLDEISSTALRLIGKGELASDCGVTINSDVVRYFRVQPARLKDALGMPLLVNLLVRISGSDMVVWSTPQSLSGAGANQPVLTSELQLGSELRTDDSLMYCLDRFFEKFTPHKMHSPALTTRAYMNVLIMIANQGTVGQIRSEQAARQA